MLDDLESELSKLYPTQAHARRVADYAGIPSVFVDFEEPVALIWHQIVAQANARRMVGELVDVAIKDYPRSTVLQQVRGYFKYGGSSNSAGANDTDGLMASENKFDKMYEMVYEMRRDVAVLRVWLIAITGIIALAALVVGIKVF